MDRAETIARDHLICRGFPNPVYEPDGNVPPDFLLEGRIAVEVRRLNQNERGTPSPKGLEQTEIPLLSSLQKLLQSFGPPVHSAWWLSVHFSRPVPAWKTLAPPVKAFLEGIRDGQRQIPSAFSPCASVTFEARPRADAAHEMFHLAMIRDGDSGGWVVEEVHRNLQLVVAEKSAKTSTVRSRYPEWWLVLVDQLAYSMSEYDRAQFRESATISHNWDKIVLVNPLDSADYFELP